MAYCSGSMAAGDVRWWAAALAARRVTILAGERRLSLRHSHHRYAIVGPGGVQQLSVPIAGTSRHAATPMSQVGISEHANWRHTHWGALYSAYGQTPYFDHVAPDLHAVVHGGQTLLLDYNRQLAQLIVDFMQLPVELTYSPLGTPAEAALTPLDSIATRDVAYYQLWSERHGFRPGLSVLDLMMNEGPEGIFTLMKMTQTGTGY